jgi:hypothetical protein
MLPAMERQDHDLFTLDPEVDCVRKQRQHRSPRFTVRELERQWIVGDAHHKLVDGAAKLSPDPFASSLVPRAHFKRVIFGLGPENNPPCHAQPNNFRRTSAQGMAEPGFSTCSAHRRSSSAR